jgi:hypothetical protein
MSILDDISSDLDWRESEIASMRIVLTSPNITPTQKSVLLRAAWALLYAHYEGFCKNTLVSYYDFISNSGVETQSLPQSTRAFALAEKLSELRKIPNNEFLEEVSGFEVNYLTVTPKFPDVDIRSNLWPSVLIELLEIADLNSDKIEHHELKLKTLVARRNKIAHGENNIISEFEYYREFEDVVYDVMYSLAFQVEERLSQAPFAA